MNSSSHFDAIVIGGGHNGLVAAAYLGKGGKRVLVLERRAIVGGACVTEEISPGFKVSTTSYVSSLFRPEITRDLRLDQYGVELLQRNPSSFTPLPDGRYLFFWADQKKTLEEIAKFSRRDAEQYPKYEAALESVVKVIEPLLMQEPIAPWNMRLGDLGSLVKQGLEAYRHKESLSELVRLMGMSAADFLDNFFEGEALKATLATDGVIGAFAGPRTPGTAYILIHHVMGESHGVKGSWGYIKGGMGALTQALARVAQDLGAIVKTSAPVRKILLRGGKAVGVATEAGDEYHAPLILSNADPKRTFLDMLGEEHLSPEFLSEIKRIRYRSATTKINLCLSGLPSWKALPGMEVGPQHRGTIHISPTMEYIEQAWRDAQNGRVSVNPILEATIPTSVDSTIAPPGKHIMGLFTQYTPYDLAEGRWDEAAKRRYADRCLEILSEYAPNIKDLVLHVQVLSPLDLEQEYGLTGGNLFHGEMTLDQLAFMRPHPRYSRYATPVPGLYLCGSGAHPGGGVMGAPGYLAAKAALRAPAVVR